MNQTQAKQSKCKHQFFKLRKISKHTTPAKRENKRMMKEYMESAKANKGSFFGIIGPLFIKPSIKGIRVKCALCDLQKDIYENE